MADTTPHLEIRPDRSLAGRVQAWRGDALVASFHVVDDDGSQPVIDIQVHGRSATLDDAEAIVRAARELTWGRVPVLEVTDLLVRHEARRVGFTGALRKRLSIVRPAPAAVGAHDDLRPRWELLRDLVQELVPGVAVAGRPAGGVVRRATSGLAGMVDLAVRPPDGGPLVVSCPDREDIVPEAVALAIDTVAAIRSRFPIARTAVRRVSFDHSRRGLRQVKWAGLAHPNLATIHLNASLASTAGLDAVARRPPSPIPPARVPPPATTVDSVVAHECWHQMEAAMEARWYRDTMELRRRLGQYFGVATLEHAVLGGAPGAPEDWRRAHTQLVDEVSPYGGTARREATAEMFKLWWCSPADRRTPAVDHFAAVVTDLKLLHPRR
jgi:hypothetical protein